MFHVTLFALLAALFLLFASGAAGAGQFVVAVPAALLALWMGDAAVRSGRSAMRRRRANTTTDGRR